MNDEVVISWSLQNWITVLAMGLVFFVVLVLLSKAARKVLVKPSSAEGLA